MLTRLILCLVLASVSAGCASDAEPSARRQAAPPPAPDSAIPRHPAALADRLTATHRALDAAVERWRGEGDPRRGGPPHDVTLYALDEQRIHLLLAKRRELAPRVLALTPGRVDAHVRATLRAKRALNALYVPVTRSHWRTGRARPAGELLGFYREARRRFGVQVHVLAAVNLVESAFGRLRNTSTAGAQGPMQFIPSTWAAYGMGGDIRDPRDAILGAANYLRASGAPRDIRRALYAYNPSDHYVNAVLAYAERIRRDPRAYFSYYSWQVYVRTTAGTRRITGPGL
ncbi:MAG TPA: lytic transglycosylase domain-containing protein [Thermoleophilaceae bacterium]|nr:lytic transglycosylase domain-containing protein [Thermoleophilaceae bacterium]